MRVIMCVSVGMNVCVRGVCGGGSECVCECACYYVCEYMCVVVVCVYVC